MHIDHLDRGHLVQHRPRRQSRRQRAQPSLQCDLQAVGQERHEDMRLDTRIVLMIDRPDRQIPLEFLERLLDIP